MKKLKQLQKDKLKLECKNLQADLELKRTNAWLALVGMALKLYLASLATMGLVSQLMKLNLGG